MPSGTEYQKISSLYLFDAETRSYTDKFSTPELEALQDAEWIFTEKVDGTNIRVIWDGYRVTLAGRTDNTQLPPKLLTKLQDLFAGPDNEKLFEQKFGTNAIVLYGEGFGGKIQKGGKYQPEESFVLFDVKVDGIWLQRENVVDVGDYFTVRTVPVILYGPLKDAIEYVKAGMASTWNDGQYEAEGMVGVTTAGLLDRRGKRIAVKIKARDLK